MMLEEMELDGATPATSTGRRRRRRREPRPRRGHRRRHVGAAGRRSASRRPASPTRSSRRTPASAAPGSRTRYPGCRVDVGNHFYCYSFEPSDDWTEFFAQQPELQALLRARAWTSTASTEHIRFEHRGRRRRAGTTTTATLDRSSASPTAPRRRSTARAVISAVGQLNRPTLPDIAGLDSFDGAVVPLGPVGPLGRPRRASGSRWSAPAPAASRSCRPSPTDVEHAHRLPAHRRSGCSPTRTTTTQVGPRRAAGRSSTCRSTAAGTGSCSSGRRATAAWSPRSSTPTGRHQDRSVSEINDVTREIFTDWIVEPGRRRPRPAREGRARLPADRQAHAAGQRQLADHADARRTSSWSGPASSALEPDGVVDRGRHRPRGRRDRVRHRLPGQRVPAGRWRSVGRDGARPPASSGAIRPRAYLGITVPGLPEPVLPLRARHEPGPRRQPDLPLRVPDPLHRPVPRGGRRRRRQRRSSHAARSTTSGTRSARPS